MIHPSKSDIGRHVTCRVYIGTEGRTVRGRTAGLSEMVVEVRLEDAGVPELRNRVDLCWSEKHE